jgi:hypothetical protein
MNIFFLQLINRMAPFIFSMGPKGPVSQMNRPNQYLPKICVQSEAADHSNLLGHHWPVEWIWMGTDMGNWQVKLRRTGRGGVMIDVMLIQE